MDRKKHILIAILILSKCYFTLFVSGPKEKKKKSQLCRIILTY